MVYPICTKSKRDVERCGTSCWDTRETESTVRVVLIDPSVHGALGADEDRADHSLEGSETREDMSEDYRLGGHPGALFIRTIWKWLPSAEDEMRTMMD